jgi:UPF0716 family protein affecting phage T7 exclusion
VGAIAWFVIAFVVAVIGGSGIAGVVTATAAVGLLLFVRWQGFSSLLERIRNSNVLDERPAVEERERPTEAGLRE